MTQSIRRHASLALALATGLAFASPSHAALALTPEGIADGFTLSTVVGGYFGTYGPLGEGMLPNGDFITGSASTDRIYVFKDVDNQTLSSAVTSVPYTFQTGNPQYVMASAAGKVYGAQLFGGTFVQFASDGSSTPLPGLTGLAAYLGMWSNPVNGHLIASSYQGLVDINPVAGTFRVINASVFPDGVTVSSDGKTLFAEVGGNINGYSVATGALLSSFSGNGHSPDGTGVIAGGAFSGDIVVNNNDGTVGLIDTANGIETIIASGGTRGDFVSPDTTNGTLFLSQYDQIARLSCGSGCSIGGGPEPSPVPEPGSAGLLAFGLAGLVALRRRWHA